jgi:hypothetical protein
VINTEEGWIPHVEVLAPPQVAEVARDLESVTAADIRDMLRGTGNPNRSADDFRYVTQYVRDARDFTARQASGGRGLIYFIG